MLFRFIHYNKREKEWTVMNLTGRPYNQQYKSTINTADVTKTLHIYTKMLFPCTCSWVKYKFVTLILEKKTFWTGWRSAGQRRAHVCAWQRHRCSRISWGCPWQSRPRHRCFCSIYNCDPAPHSCTPGQQWWQESGTCSQPVPAPTGFPIGWALTTIEHDMVLNTKTLTMVFTIHQKWRQGMRWVQKSWGSQCAW